MRGVGGPQRLECPAAPIPEPPEPTMRRTFLLLPAFLAACTSVKEPEDTMASASTGSRGNKKTSEPEKVLPFAVHKSTLDNGLRVLVVPTPSDGLVSYWSVVRTGSRDEVE